MLHLCDFSPYGTSPPIPATGSGKPPLADVPDRDTCTNLLVPLASLAVTCGAALGERLEVPEDLVLGDVIRIAPSAVTFPVLGRVGDSDEVEVILHHVDIGTHRLRGAMVKTVIVMSNTGQAHHARVIQTLTQGVFVLFEKAIEQGAEYTLIHEYYKDYQADPRHVETAGNVQER